jgi:hypothetical protein
MIDFKLILKNKKGETLPEIPQMDFNKNFEAEALILLTPPETDISNSHVFPNGSIVTFEMSPLYNLTFHDVQCILPKVLAKYWKEEVVNIEAINNTLIVTLDV